MYEESEPSFIVSKVV